MSRPSVHEGIALLADMQSRREMKALLDRINSFEKHRNEQDTENKRQFESIQQDKAAIKQDIKELKENLVLQQESEADKELAKAREGMDSFLATEQQKTMAVQRIAEREEQRHHAVNKHPIILDRLKDVETQILPISKQYVSPFFRPDENQAQASDSLSEPSIPELQAMRGPVSPATTEDLSNDEEDDARDDFIAFLHREKGDQRNQLPRDMTHEDGTQPGKEHGNWDVPWAPRRGDLSKQAPRDMTDGDGARFSEEHGDWDGPWARKRRDLSEQAPRDMMRREGVGLDEEDAHGNRTRRGDGFAIAILKKGEAVPARPPMFGQPSRRTAGIDQFSERPGNNPDSSENRLKRPHNSTSNVSARVDEHIAEQERNKINNLSSSKRHRALNSTPPEHDTVSEELIEPPPPPHKPLPKPGTINRKTRVKPTPKTITPVTSRPFYGASVSRPLSNPEPKPAVKLPRLVQGKTPLAKYYKDANEAFLTYEGRDEAGQQEFVIRFLAGIHLKKDRDEAIDMLQQKEESTVRNQKPWILCEWKDVLKSLLFAKLVKKDDVN